MNRTKRKTMGGEEGLCSCKRVARTRYFECESSRTNSNTQRGEEKRKRDFKNLITARRRTRELTQGLTSAYTHLEKQKKKKKVATKFGYKLEKPTRTTAKERTDTEKKMLAIFSIERMHA